ncbi:MAG: PqqD family protein [Acidimicrobiia bacterium]
MAYDPAAHPSRLARSPRVLTRQGEFGVLVLGPDDAEPFALEGSAREVWEAFAEPATLDDVVTRLARRFAVDRTTVAHDVTDLVQGLVTRGVLVARP